jgi:dipeptidyl aminopeptidase/acylaminoacyl peptidase
MRKFLFVSLFLLFCLLNFAQNEKTTAINVDDYLLLGPIKVTIPVDAEDELKTYLNYEEMYVRNWWPANGDNIFTYSNSALQWTNSEGTELKFSKNEKPTIYYTGFYVETNRWVEAEISAESNHLIAIYFDGEKKTDKLNFDDDEPGKASTNVQLENGKHLVLLKLLFDPAKEKNWSVSSKLSFDQKYVGSISVTTNPIRTTTVGDLLDNPSVTSISLSPNGEYVALKMKERNKIKDEYDNWIELRKVSDGNLVWTFKGGMNIPEVDWAPDSKSFAYTTISNESKTLWIVNLENGTTEALIQNVKNMGGFSWADNGEFIVYSVTEKAEEKDPNFKKYELPEDRWPGFRDKNYIYRVFVKSKMTERLTAGDESTNFIEISPDSKMILYSKVFYGQPKRPYYRTDYYILNLESMQADSILSLYFSSGISWSPDSKQLLILGGSTTFDEIGNTLPENIIPNDYDTQAYIYDITSKEAKSITKNFDPQINDAKWDGKHNVIYFTTTDESYKHLYRYDITSGHYELIELGSEVLHSIDYSNDFSTAIFKASSSNIPEKVYKIDLLTGKVETFLFPEEKQYRHIKLGEVKDWDFISSTGQKIKGRIYYPPNFDESQKYPAIVYYYAGTSPIERDFGGRYPKNIWAANGYIVYTLQPSGATGFGTEFSAKHVNDWGTLTAQEIIEGTEKFVSAHKYVDPNKLGCLGASYGGFETMSLITKTDMFSAAISHAGISNLTSYWGVGYWGYSYNAVAAAESFPWNRRDVYVDKSPLFSADKINTPLLLLHGNTDPNVPPGESMQMYVALKLLNKDVTLIEIDKQQHWILDYDKRTKWTKTIIAYFDKYLKGQPEWWNSLYN